MSKYTLIDVANLQNESTVVTALTSNNSTIEDAFDNTISRDGTTPNHMNANFDMNSNRIINLPEALSTTEPITLGQASVLSGGGTVESIPSGGLTAEVLKKISDSDFDVEWGTVGTDNLADSSVTTIKIADDNVTNAKIAESSAWTIKGNSTSSSANPQDFTVSGLTTKSFPTNSDWFLLSDSAASNAFKKTSPSGLLGPLYNPRAYGAVGDGSTDDYTAINNCVTDAVAANGTVVFTDGDYAFGSTLNLGFTNLKIVPFGSNVILRHTGTGVGLKFDGMLNYPASQGCLYGSFGEGPGRIKVLGNANTTNLTYFDNWHWGYFKADLGKACSNAFMWFTDTGIVGASAVETILDIRISYNVDGAFTTVPWYGVYGSALAACTFWNPTIEGVGNVANATLGFNLINSTRTLVLGGTTESCLAGGVAINNGRCNTFINHHSEVNGNQQDWLIASNNNSFIGCAGAGTTSGQYLSGDRNVFSNCVFQTMSIQAGAEDNIFDSCVFQTSFSDLGTRTVIRNPDALATAANPSIESLSNKTIGNSNTVTLKDTSFTLQDDGDATKQAKFQLSGITTGNTRTYTLPDANGTFLYSGGPLGTPSSGTVTNLTGTAGININGTVGATTPNTGAFTTVAASGLISANGGQIAFPASQNASANANTLDDYEEGSFTPTLTFGGGSTGLTYSSQTGTYTKIGNMVSFRLQLNLTAKGSSTGAAVITGLPFSVNATTPVNSRFNNGAASATTAVQAIGVNATQSINLEKFTAGASSSMTDADFTNTSIVMVAGVYFV